jgi:nucleoside-diphosphate-sugar epimerase
MMQPETKLSCEDRRVLLVGGAGYVGSVLTGYLLERGYRVRSHDLLLYENHPCVTPFLGRAGYEFRYGDLCDADTVRSLLSGVTDVVLLGGLVGDPITKKYPQESAAINDRGVRRCIDALEGHGLRRVIFISTCSNYGLIGDGELAVEEFELRPLSLYAKAKVAAEEHLLALRGKVDYQATILRFATAFGLSPRMRFDLTVNEFTRELFLGRELLVYDPDTWRPYCHVRDLSRLIEKVLQCPDDRTAFQVFNVGGEANNLTKRAIVEAVLRELPHAKVAYQAHGPDPRNYRVSFRKVRETLGFEPQYSVADGVRELVEALGQHVFDAVDGHANMYGNYHVNYTPHE